MSDMWSTPSSGTPVSGTPSSGTPPSGGQQQSGADLAYTGLATYGLFNALIGAVVATIVGVIFVIMGIMELRSTPTKSISANIVGINNSATAVCPSSSNTNTVNNTTTTTTTYNCTLNLSFIYQGTTYTPSLSYNGTSNYTIGQSLTVYFTDDPSKVSLTENNPSTGWIAIFLGIGISALAWVMYWAARKWKAVAAIEGGESLINSFSGNRGGGGGYSSNSGGTGILNGVNLGGLLNGVRI